MYAYYATISGWLTRDGFRRDATILFTSAALARGILILSMPLLARCFTPADIGNWQLFVSLAAVMGTIVCWRYEVAIPLPSDVQRARNLVGTCALLAVGTSSLLALLILLFRGQFVRWIATPALDDYLWLLPIFTLLFGLEQAATFWLTRTGDFASQGASRLLKSALMMAIPLGLAMAFDVRFGYLIAGTMVGQLAATAYLLRRETWIATEWQLGRERARRLGSVMAEYRNYPMYVAPYTFVGQFSKRLVYFLLAAFATSSTVGIFAMAMQITYIPITFITSGLNQAFYRKASSHDDIRMLEPLVLKTLTLQTILAVPLFTLLVLHSRYVLRFVLGAGWDETADFAAWLAAPSLMMFLTAWLDRVYDKLGRQKLAVVLQICIDTISIGLLVLLLATGHSALASIASYSVVIAAYNACWLVIMFHTARFSMQALARLALLASILVGIIVGAHLISQSLFNEASALIIELLLAAFVQFIAIRSL